MRVEKTVQEEHVEEEKQWAESGPLRNASSEEEARSGGPLRRPRGGRRGRMGTIATFWDQGIESFKESPQGQV